MESLEMKGGKKRKVEEKRSDTAKFGMEQDKYIPVVDRICVT